VRCAQLREKRRILKCENCGRKATLKCYNCGYEPTKDEMIAEIITLRQENAELRRELILTLNENHALRGWQVEGAQLEVSPDTWDAELRKEAKGLK
jgi:hypothetical protein